MNPYNKIPILLVPPLTAVAVFAIGGRFGAPAPEIVDNVRQWLVILLAVYAVNHVVGALVPDAFGVTVGRLLGCGLFAYICISRLVDLIGAHFHHLAQLFGAAGALTAAQAGAVRFAIVGWGAGLLMMVVCIAVGSSSEDSSPDD